MYILWYILKHPCITHKCIVAIVWGVITRKKGLYMFSSDAVFSPNIFDALLIVPMDVESENMES